MSAVSMKHICNLQVPFQKYKKNAVGFKLACGAHSDIPSVKWSTVCNLCLMSHPDSIMGYRIFEEQSQ